MAASLTEGLSPAEQAQFAALRCRFLAGLSARRLEIRAASEPGSLRMNLHRLAGAAAMHGFDRLHQLAQRAEALVADAALAQALLALEAEIARLQAAAADPLGPA